MSLTGAPAASASPPALNTSAVVGTWSVAPGSVADYRVREKLRFLPVPSDGVGRTLAIAGTMTVTRHGDAFAVTAATFTANLRLLKTDRAMRDNRIRTLGLDSDRYPLATFRLAQPTILPAASLRGKQIHSRITGLLTIHGTTRRVTMPTDSQLRNVRIEVVGSISFPLTLVNMQPPTSAGFVSVENHATMEVDLVLRRR